MCFHIDCHILFLYIEPVVKGSMCISATLTKLCCEFDSCAFVIILCTFILLSQYKNLTDVKYEVLSLGCRKGDLECVKMMINKYECDPKGL